MIYQRGSRGSYDRWAAEVGDDDFKWDNIKNFFDKTVNVTPYNNPFRAGNASVAEYVVPQSAHESGPLQVSWPNFAMPFSSWGLQGLFAGGMPRLTGFFSDGELHGAAYNVCCFLIRPVINTNDLAAFHNRPKISDTIVL